jgi:hypothetical protein
MEEPVKPEDNKKDNEMNVDEENIVAIGKRNHQRDVLKPLKKVGYRKIEIGHLIIKQCCWN